MLKIYIDRTTGTWGLASDLEILDATSIDLDALENMSDSEIIAYRKGETK